MSDNATILLVERGNAELERLRANLEGLHLLLAKDQDDALTLLRQHKPQVAVIGLGHAATSSGTPPGLALLSRILDAEPATKVVAVSPGLDREVAVDAVGRGVWDVLEFHPWSPRHSVLWSTEPWR